MTAPDPATVRALLEDSLRTSPPLRPAQRAVVSVAFNDTVRSVARSASADRLGRGKAAVSS